MSAVSLAPSSLGALGAAISGSSSTPSSSSNAAFSGVLDRIAIAPPPGGGMPPKQPVPTGSHQIQAGQATLDTGTDDPGSDRPAVGDRDGSDQPTLVDVSALAQAASLSAVLAPPTNVLLASGPVANPGDDKAVQKEAGSAQDPQLSPKLAAAASTDRAVSSAPDPASNRGGAQSQPQAGAEGSRDATASMQQFQGRPSSPPAPTTSAPTGKAGTSREMPASMPQSAVASSPAARGSAPAGLNSSNSPAARDAATTVDEAGLGRSEADPKLLAASSAERSQEVQPSAPSTPKSEVAGPQDVSSPVQGARGQPNQRDASANGGKGHSGSSSGDKTDAKRVGGVGATTAQASASTAVQSLSPGDASGAAQQVAAALQSLRPQSVTSQTQVQGSRASSAVEGAAKTGTTPNLKTLTIQLHPDQLGPVSITMRLNSAGMDVQIAVANPQTLRLLERDRHLLSAAIDAAGTKDSISLVSLSSHPSGSDQGPSSSLQHNGGNGQQAAFSSGASTGGSAGSRRDQTDTSSPIQSEPDDALPSSPGVSRRTDDSLYL